MRKGVVLIVVAVVVASCGKVPPINTDDLVPVQQSHCLDTADTAMECKK